MEAAAALACVVRVQRALRVLAALTLTAYMFPEQAAVPEGEEVDFIVVGGGSAGAVLAARLAAGVGRVLLLEAGGDPPYESVMPGLLGYLPRSRYDWNYTTVPDGSSFQCHRGGVANLTAGRMLGGGSSINYMLYVRGCPGDFVPWAAAAKDPTWTWNGVLPYFIRSENLKDEEILFSPQGIYHGTGGFLGVSRQPTASAGKLLESFKDLGHDIILDINADCQLGYTQPMFTISDGIRQSTATTILAAQKGNTNLRVLKETYVTRIIFDDSNNAVGVEATTANNKKLILRAKNEIIVSAGALNTPRLLMLSGIGPEKHLKSLNIPIRSNLPVGMNLQDHVAILLAFRLEESNDPPPVADPRRFPFDAFTGYVALNKSNTCPDYQAINFIVPNDAESVLDMCVFNFGLDFEICQNFYEAGKGSRTLFTTFVILHPKSRGRVLLRSANPADPPTVYGGHLSDDRDLETVVDSLIDFVKVLNTTYFKSINASMVDLRLGMCSQLRYWSREWWRCYAKCMITTMFHYSGTSALGAVVDSRLRVLGVSRLRVADASVMPELVSANTNPAVIMIAEKAADFIKQDYPYLPTTSGVGFPFYYFPGWKSLNFFG